MKNDAFGNIYDSMNHNYRNLENIMADLYNYLKNNPSDDLARNTLERLCTIGQDMIYSQKEFTKYYCDGREKNNLINNLDSKSHALSQAQKDTKAMLR